MLGLGLESSCSTSTGRCVIQMQSNNQKAWQTSQVEPKTYMLLFLLAQDPWVHMYSQTSIQAYKSSEYFDK